MESCRYYAASHVVVHSGGAGGRREEGVEVDSTIPLGRYGRYIK